MSRSRKVQIHAKHLSCKLEQMVCNLPFMLSTAGLREVNKVCLYIIYGSYFTVK